MPRTHFSYGNYTVIIQTNTITAKLNSQWKKIPKPYSYKNRYQRLLLCLHKYFIFLRYYQAAAFALDHYLIPCFKIKSWKPCLLNPYCQSGLYLYPNYSITINRLYSHMPCKLFPVAKFFCAFTKLYNLLPFYILDFPLEPKRTMT